MPTCAISHSNSKLAQIRVSNDFTLADVSEVTGIHSSRISSFECGYVREIREENITPELKNLWDLYGIASLQEFNRLLEDAYQLNKVKTPETYNTCESLRQGNGPIQKKKASDEENPNSTNMKHLTENQESNNNKSEEKNMNTQTYTKEQIEALLKRLYTSLEYEDFMMVLSLIPQELRSE